VPSCAFYPFLVSHLHLFFWKFDRQKFR